MRNSAGRRFSWRLLLTAFCLAAGAAGANTHVVYPLTSQDDLDSRYDYDWAVLRTALEKTEPRYGPFEMRQSTQVMSPQVKRNQWRICSKHLWTP